MAVELLIYLDSAGLVCFCYVTQVPYVAITILVVTCFCSFGLFGVVTWLFAERWIYSKHPHLRHLYEILENQFRPFLSPSPGKYISRRIRTGFRNLLDSFSCRGSYFTEMEDGLPFPNAVNLRERPIPSQVKYRRARVSGSVGKSVKFVDNQVVPTQQVGAENPPVTPTLVLPPSRSRHVNFASTTVESTTTTSHHGVAITTPEGSTSKLKGVNRFRWLAWRVAADQSIDSASPLPVTAGGYIRSATTLPDPVRRRDTDEGPNQMNAERTNLLRLTLRNLRVTDTKRDHTAVVRHLQFSSNGKILATCGWDGTVRLFNVPAVAGEPFLPRNVMNVAGKTPGTVMLWGQTAWSPDGRWLLTKWMTGIQVWTDVCICKFQIMVLNDIFWVDWNSEGHHRTRQKSNGPIGSMATL